MKIRKQLPLTSAMAAAMLALPACSEREQWNGDVAAKNDTAFCIDQDGRRIDDENCREASNRGYYAGGVRRGNQWYYMGRGSPLPYYGESIYDRRFEAHGAFQPRPGLSYTHAPADTRMTRSRAISRGGLGSSGRRYGGGWS